MQVDQQKLLELQTKATNWIQNNKDLQIESKLVQYYTEINNIKRFFIARDLDIEKSLEMWQKYVYWHQQERPDKIQLKDVQDALQRSELCYILGEDKEKRGVIFVQSTKLLKVNQDESYLLIKYMLETAINISLKNGNQKIVVIYDNKGFGSKDMCTENLDKSKKGLAILQDYYPQRVQRKQETFKQIHQKMTKKNTAPLPLWFDKWQSMESISTKKEELQQTFDLMNTRGLNISILFSWKQSNLLYPEELFFFLDCFFRGISKILIKKDQKTPQNVNRRLFSQSIKDIIETLFSGQNNTEYIQSEKLPEVLAKDQKLYQFFQYIHQTLQASLEHGRLEALKNFKIKTEIKKLALQMVFEVEKRIKKEEEEKNKEQNDTKQ
ncbi:CRAL-TRIO domain [Pseudocohnilembus persalinus]|uniref:CRAL-TRIO domain n=1 Tax=Pseudocohnilembus persalinus TaxID=266149 RepID=A0A0V0QX48_PSEPJ|nr:CRAL-TRIO domain [Pseudocohnilembus persalinus]|eukprot:KRX06634.1 CRAL-TRIO domain [Pseudocohnilembus persalinus]